VAEPVAEAPEAPAPVAPERVRRSPPAVKARPPVAAKARPRTPAPASASGVAAGAVAGEAGGAVGGVAGGIAGGVVGGTGTAPVPASQVAHPPQVIHRVSPTYPAEARRGDVQGLVVVEAILDRDGRIEPGVRVLKSVPQLDAEAVAAVRQWRFRPARSAAGEPLRVILEIPIRFVLT
jgi:protein TonB